MFKKHIKEALKFFLPAFIKKFILKRLSLLVIPKDINSVVSDQFPFRAGDWITYFELLNLPALFDPINNDTSYKAKFIFFDADGGVILQHEIQKDGVYRNTISVNSILAGINACKIGTFSCFHENYPEWLKSEKAHLAERGYVGYKNNKISDTKGYVHGNFDAIARNDQGALLSLGTWGLRLREYKLQHELYGPAIYELAFVNTTHKTQKLKINLQFSTFEEDCNSELIIPSRGIRIYKTSLNRGQTGKITIFSRLNLARPVVFRVEEESFDVFHG